MIGATLQQRLPWLSNELVNGLQTLLAALLAMGSAAALGGGACWPETTHPWGHTLGPASTPLNAHC